MPLLDAAWREWLNFNVGRGCTPQSMVDAMVQAGFDRDGAESAVRAAAGGSVAGSAATAGASAGGAAAVPGTAAYVYDPAPVAAGNTIHIQGRAVRVLMRCERPQIIAVADLVSPEECAELIRRAQHRLQRSTTIDPRTGQEFVIQDRTSRGTAFLRGEDAFVDAIDQRIAALMNWPVENGEGLQVLHYGVGGEYRPHYDYFPPEQPGSAVQMVHGGQRVATLVLYLNDVAEGGETLFPEAGISVSARAGGAVYFRYMNGRRQLDPLTLHAGAPVRSGEKWIMTKWMRERARP
ncbi:MAG TPA: 2OG-Fe(II) oxygenase [Steroidobacteraceae bacterium]|nr:2OG-Fe(II) oxygenase [Steroidobacteraceae bacterium]